MIQMEQKHFEVIRQYVDLIEIIEEGFEYIEGQYKVDAIMAGDRILGDVFLAFSQIEGANQIILDIFNGEHSVKQEIQMFHSIIEIVKELEDNFQDDEEKKRIVLSKLIPAFSAWQLLIEAEFKPYLQH
jgi:transcription termination factor Rho